MADQSAIYIASISGGKCIENTQQAKGECRLRKWNKSSSQQWLVEPSDEGPNIVAFKSVSDQQYLAALQPDKMNGGKIGVQQEKQWFTLEPGRGPEWWHVKCNSSFGSGKPGYLNDEWGRLNDDNKIQTYQYEVSWPLLRTDLRVVLMRVFLPRKITRGSIRSTSLPLRLRTPRASICLLPLLMAKT